MLDNVRTTSKLVKKVLKEGKPFIITGMNGQGKTLLIKELLSSLDSVILFDTIEFIIDNKHEFKSFEEEDKERQVEVIKDFLNNGEVYNSKDVFLFDGLGDGFHLATISLFCEVLQEHYKDKKIVITTHSPAVLMSLKTYSLHNIRDGKLTTTERSY